MSLPRTWLALVILAALSLQFCTSISAQAVGFRTSSNALSAASTQNSPIQVSSQTSIAGASSTLYNDTVILARLGSLNSLPTTTITGTTTSPADWSVVPTSVATTQPNVNPFFSTSLNTLPNSTAFLTSMPTVGAPSIVATPPPTIMNWRLGSSYLASRSSTSGAGSQQTDLGTAGGNGSYSPVPVAGGPSIPTGYGAPLFSVPEPSTYLLCGAVVLAAGYGFLWRRWKQETASPAKPTQSAEESMESSPRSTSLVN